MSTNSPEEIEEERRLFYVALTRAKNSLYVCYPQRYYFHGRYRSDSHSYAQLTRFLDDDIVQHHFTRKHFAEIDEDPEEDETDSVNLTTDDVRRRTKSIWS